MKTAIINEVKPGVFEVKVGSKIEIAYGSDAMEATRKRLTSESSKPKIDEQFVDLYTDACGNCYSDADPGL
jgi:hypothetical protein